MSSLQVNTNDEEIDTSHRTKSPLCQELEQRMQASLCFAYRNVLSKRIRCLTGCQEGWQFAEIGYVTDLSKCCCVYWS